MKTKEKKGVGGVWKNYFRGIMLRCNKAQKRKKKKSKDSQTIKTSDIYNKIIKTCSGIVNFFIKHKFPLPLLLPLAMEERKKTLASLLL